MVDQNGTEVPVEFKRVELQSGPVIEVVCNDTQIRHYFTQVIGQPDEPQTNPAKSFWSSFLSLPMAEAGSLPEINLPTVFELSNLNGENGFILYSNHQDDSGFSVSSAGDINGDNITDLVVGAPALEGELAGGSYVIFGRKGIWNSPIVLSSLNGTNGFILNGENPVDSSGHSVSCAGDINDDGIADLVVGAPYINQVLGTKYTGNSYVIFGHKGTWNSPIELSSLNGTNGFILNGENPFDHCGVSVSGAGDINGDGIADLVVGAFGASPGGAQNAGRTYVIFGCRSRWNSTFDLSSLNGTNGFILNGENGDFSGWSVSGAGDINGDGIADLVVGDEGASPEGRHNAGRSYVIFGHKGSWNSPIELSSLNGTNGFMLIGEKGGDTSGYSVSGAGDINGDGIADLVVGAPQASPEGRQLAGSSYLIFGSRGRWNSPIDLSSLNGTNGIILNGENEGDRSGFSVSGAGDFNNDGIADLAVGAPESATTGLTYVIFGHKGRWISPIELSSLNGINGIMLKGENEGEQSGSSLSGAGDINDDGIADLVVGAPNAFKNTGRTYVIFGKKTHDNNNQNPPATNSNFTPLIIGSSVGGVALIGLSALGICLYKKRKNKDLGKKSEVQSLIDYAENLTSHTQSKNLFNPAPL